MRELQKDRSLLYTFVTAFLLLMMMSGQPGFALGKQSGENNDPDSSTSGTIPVAGIITVSNLPGPVPENRDVEIPIRGENLTGSSNQAGTNQEPSANEISPQHIAVPSSVDGLAYSQNPFKLTPPDGALGVGPLNVMEMVNVIGQVYTRTGTPIGTPFTINSFFKISSSAFASDPKILYDALSGRFFVSELSCSTSSCGSTSTKFVDLAVSQSNDATGSFCIYHIGYSTTLPDQPIIGLGSDKVIVSVNEFASGITFVGAEYAVLSKSDLTSCLTVHFTSFGPFASDFSIHPVQSLTSTTTEYMVNTRSGTTTGTVRLYAVTGVPPGKVTVKITALKVSPIITPPASVQKGSGFKLDTGDVRTEDAVFWNNEIWLVHTNKCTPKGDTTLRSCLHFVEINTATTKVVQDFNLGTAGKYNMYPALRIDSVGDLLVVFGFASTSDFPGVMVTEQSITDPIGSLETPLLLKAGAGPVTLTFGCGPGAGLPTNVCRYGDYFAAATDPILPKTAWVEGEWGDGATDPSFGGEWGTELGVITG